MSRKKEDYAAMEDALCEILAEIGKSRTGIGVCLSAIAMARIAYEPFRLCTLEEFDAKHMTLAEANEILAQDHSCWFDAKMAEVRAMPMPLTERILGYYPSDPPIPIVDK